MRSIVRGRTVDHRHRQPRFALPRIVGMPRGEIVEIGGHEELLAQQDEALPRPPLGALPPNQARAPA